MILYNSHSSSACYGARIGLELKGLDYKYVPIRLNLEQGEQDTAAYRGLSPQKSVPVLVDGKTKIAQSVAILEYLEERYPSPSLLPPGVANRAWVRSLALHIACEIQPLISLRVERYLTWERGNGAPAFWAWLRHWITTGFDGVEAMLAARSRSNTYCSGDDPTLADCFLVPQVHDALHPVIGIDLSDWPNIHRVYAACSEHIAFRRAHPENQPDRGNPPQHSRTGENTMSKVSGRTDQNRSRQVEQ